MHTIGAALYGRRATSAMDNNKLYTINTLRDKRAPHATATLSTGFESNPTIDCADIEIQCT